MKSSEIVRLERVSKIYGLGDVEIKALDDIDFTIDDKGRIVLKKI